MTADLIFHIKSLLFKYPDGTVALSDINMDIRQGEFIGILGANGCGKTTLLKVMDGLFKKFEGKVHLKNQDITKLTPKQIYREIGLVFQNPDDQLFAPTLFEDVAFGPHNMGFEDQEINTRVLKSLKDVGLEGNENKPIHHLSFGQKKRACIAGLLAMGHTTLLLDEPTAGLDPLGEHTMMRLLQQLNKEKNVTIVMATHSVDLIPLFLNRLYILDKGNLIQKGTPEEVFKHPDELATAKLRLPQVAELIYKLKHQDNMPFKKLPLTIGEARQEILNLFCKDSGMPEPYEINNTNYVK